MKALDNLAFIAEGMKRYESLKNFSGTAYTGMAGAGLFGLFNPLMWPKLVGALAGTALLGHLLTSQTYVNRFLIPSLRIKKQIGHGRNGDTPGGGRCDGGYCGKHPLDCQR